MSRKIPLFYILAHRLDIFHFVETTYFSTRKFLQTKLFIISSLPSLSCRVKSIYNITTEACLTAKIFRKNPKVQLTFRLGRPSSLTIGRSLLVDRSQQKRRLKPSVSHFLRGVRGGRRRKDELPTILEHALSIVLHDKTSFPF